LTTDDGFLRPDWPAPAMVRAAVSTRDVPGASRAPYAAFNLGSRCGDEPAAVQANRHSLVNRLHLPAAPRWLTQVHGIAVATAVGADTPEADAAVGGIGEVLAIQTADCVPVLFCTDTGVTVAAAHAGWRGLCAGVIQATVVSMGVSPGSVLAWIGPCIGAASYEVGADVRDAFVAASQQADPAFAPTRPGHWLCNLEHLVRQRLLAAGVTRIYGGGFDTFADRRFYSYRRDGAASGRFASLIWLDDATAG
jgi:YfiH family protein